MADLPVTVDELPRGGERSHRFEVLLAVLLALAAVTAAFAAYRADINRGDALRQFQVANASTADANDLFGQADASQSLDEQIFVQYAKAGVAGKEELAKALREDLSPDLRRAIDAWENGQEDTPSPFAGDRPAYVQPLYAQGRQAAAAAQRQFDAANDLRRTADDYTLITVFLASALFLYGIAAVTGNRRVRYGMTGLGFAIFAGASLATLGLAL